MVFLYDIYTAAKDRPSWGRGQECSRPRTKGTSRKCSQKKIKVFSHKFAIFSQMSGAKNFFLRVLRRAPRQNNIAHDFGPFSTSQKIVLFSNLGQDIFEDLKLRGHGQELDFWGQGQSQGLQIVSSRPRTSSRTLPLILIYTKSTARTCLKYIPVDLLKHQLSGLQT